MKNPLKDYIIATAGDHKAFGPGVTVEKLRQWIEAAGGQYASKVTKETTHLVSTPDALRRNVPAAHDAKVHGIKIVTWDWLEECLRERRRKRTKAYKVVKPKAIKESRGAFGMKAMAGLTKGLKSVKAKSAAGKGKTKAKHKVELVEE